MTASMLMIALMIMTGCAQIRLVTYPGSFVWIDGDTVRSTMHMMAASLGSIENLINKRNYRWHVSESDNPVFALDRSQEMSLYRHHGRATGWATDNRQKLRYRAKRPAVFDLDQCMPCSER